MLNCLEVSLIILTPLWMAFQAECWSNKSYPGARRREPDIEETRACPGTPGQQTEVCSREGSSEGSHRCKTGRTKVKHRKAFAVGKPALSGIARYPSELSDVLATAWS